MPEHSTHPDRFSAGEYRVPTYTFGDGEQQLYPHIPNERLGAAHTPTRQADVEALTTQAAAHAATPERANSIELVRAHLDIHLDGQHVVKCRENYELAG